MQLAISAGRGWACAGLSAGLFFSHPIASSTSSLVPMTRRRDRLAMFPVHSGGNDPLPSRMNREVAVSVISQALSRASRAEKEGRIARRWRFKSIMFYGSLLAELILFAILSQPSSMPPPSSFNGGESVLGDIPNMSETSNPSHGMPSGEKPKHPAHHSSQQ